ncbi:MAG TPA: hypothetical protein VMM58_04645 [Bacteroidota bacterium]|nr:hypothetical protein [Bacteroidota bacterium]
MNDLSSRLTEELLEYFRTEKYTILGAKNVEGYRPPQRLHNDGFGDQQQKQPAVFGFDETSKRYVIGVIKADNAELESAHSLTEYDVFFDHRNSENGESSRVCFLLPPKLIPEFTAMITHYIHRDYWKNMTIIRSKLAGDAS